MIDTRKSAGGCGFESRRVHMEPKQLMLPECTCWWIEVYECCSGVWDVVISYQVREADRRCLKHGKPRWPKPASVLESC